MATIAYRTLQREINRLGNLSKDQRLKLDRIAQIAHSHGSESMTERDALNEIRGITLHYFTMLQERKA